MPISTQDEDDDRGLFTNKTTMMANFEQWIKMATDNKINSRNSWNFALIDYFHDLNVLKDAEDNINFQKASATLDGCVKIYSSRVDSVANETGILLSGLAQRKNQQLAQGINDDPDGSHREIEGAEGAVSIDPDTGLPISNELDSVNRRRNYNRVLETTLVDFDTLRMRELDQELSIDPLFKKALADFDEGGAKSLLINTLHVDKTGRIVFDATTSQEHQDDGRKDQNSQEVNKGIPTEHADDTAKSEGEDEDGDIIMGDGADKSDRTKDESALLENTPEPHSIERSSLSMVDQSVDVEDEILALGMDLIDFKFINEAELCPSVKRLKDVVMDVTKAKSFIDDVNNKNDNFLTDQDLQDAWPGAPDNNEDGFDLPADGSFGLNEDLYEELNPENEDQVGEPLNDNDGRSQDNVTSTVIDQNVMAYFDETMKKNWRGREHWKVINFKNRLGSKFSEGGSENKVARDDEMTGKEKELEKPKKSVKQRLSIDFHNFDQSAEERIFEKKKGTIEMAMKQRHNPSHYLLPDDYQFSTQKITRLFIKPSQQMSFFSHNRSAADRQRMGNTLKIDDTTVNENEEPAGLADQNFWAQNYQLREEELANNDSVGSDLNPVDNMPNPFDDNDGIDFNQAFGSEENELPDIGSPEQPIAGSAGGLTQALGKPDGKVTYSRVSKKVDIKKLKDNIWNSINNELKSMESQGPDKAFEKSPEQDQGDEELGSSDQRTTEGPQTAINMKFTEITDRIATMYTGDRKKDLSTSFCFICLLHLANEHGFTVDSTDDFADLAIKFQETRTLQKAQSVNGSELST
ncbi:LADA_0H07096g1_1 [Lachancea dasiensis]|uniref:Condensin complex subunit 2 n=1 Tax=Lachancea dasiensis TaxID=1072105 RepID=A0A1G4K1Y2_9SACH|nr:LADA_0H07096g1_1 [Lachancea dasiensis]